MESQPETLKWLHAREYTPWSVHATHSVDPKNTTEGHQGHSGAQAALLNNNIAVLVGGRELLFEAISESARLDLFDLRTEKWMSNYDISGSLSRRIGHSVTTINGNAFVFGGQRVTNCSDLFRQVFSDLYRLHYAENVLVCEEVELEEQPNQIGCAPPERSYHASAAIKIYGGSDRPKDDAILVIGGRDLSGKLLSDVWVGIMDSKPNDTNLPDGYGHSDTRKRVRWTQISPSGASPLPLSGHSAVTVSDGMQVLVIGGRLESSFLEGVYVLDVAANAWSVLSSMPTPISGRMCLTAVRMMFPMQNTTGPIHQFTEDIAEEQSMEQEELFGRDAILVYGGVSEFDSSSVTNSCVILDHVNGTSRQVSVPNLGVLSYTGHAAVVSADRKSVFLFGGVEPSNNQMLGSTSAVHFWRTQPLLSDASNDEENESNKNPIKTKIYDNGDVYTGEMDSKQLQRNGKGTCKYANDDEYEGEWVKDLRCGQGIMTFCNGDSYTGQWLDNDFHGYGVFNWHSDNQTENSETKYEGAWEHNQKHGAGTLWFSSGAKLTSDWVNGVLCNQCRIENYNDGFDNCVYIGDVLHGLPHGNGESQSSSETYVGEWAAGRRSGRGVATALDGTEYSGDWKNGKRNGFGICKYARTRDVYDGKWVGNVRCGRGICKYGNGCEYAGEWKDDKCHGHGRYTFTDGTLYEGNWKANEFCGDGAFVFGINDSTTAITES